MKTNSGKNGFHATTSAATVSGSGVAHWVRTYVPKRVVDYRLQVHYHPYSDALIQKLNSEGLQALLDMQLDPDLKRDLDAVYEFGPYVLSKPKHEIDVSHEGPYSVYNWELFFHAPLLVAVHLSKNQRFEEAQRWFHRIFDPTSTDISVPPPQRFWKFLRFREDTRPEFIADLLKDLAKDEDAKLKQRMKDAIDAWRNKPFQPHVIARNRYLAYQLNVLMKYLDNLLAWGDSLFRQDTMESLNEATQIYVLAANLLGPKPQKIPPRHKRAARSFAQLGKIDAFGNALVELENEIPFNRWSGGGGASTSSGADSVFGIARTLYFCVPQNDKLLGYWDQVADRLFKIRHCMNIEGAVRQLPLFDPPIDPGALVRAVAAGLDIASIVNNVSQPVSTIRGPLLLRKAMEVCGEVKALGNALLSALEKEDAEHLARLRQQHEERSLSLARDVRFLQWKEAEAATASLLKSRAVVWERFRHYKRILGVADADIDVLKSVDLERNVLTEEGFDAAYKELVERYTTSLAREDYRKETTVGGLMEFAGETVVGAFGGELGKTLPLNKNEDAELNIYLPSSDTFSQASTALAIAAPILAMIPQSDVLAALLGIGGKIGFGGVQLAKGAESGAAIAQKIADAFKSSADRAARLAGYYRRAEDYVLQANLATSELEQYGRQIVSSLLREQILKREYDNHLAQIEDAEARGAFLRDKFTSEELYSWMQGELSKTYYDSYKLAFDLAKRAEQTLKHELMRPELDALNPIKFGYWDSRRKGLLAGETLALDLRRLEMAYLEHDRREYEITRHVSLARLDPLALLRLKAEGSCEVSIPEWLFDMDSPGQYMRRLKTVAVSIPCVTGPYTGVYCKLSLVRSSIRVSWLGDQYARKPGDDPRFRDFAGAIQSIVTSTGQNDAGLFELNLRDERYLPFEGAGAISTWRIELPNDIPQFDYETISDLVLHLRHTAREAGHLRSPATTVVKDVLKSPDTLLQLFCLNYDFSNAWAQFTGAASGAELSLEIDQDRFPYWVERLGVDTEIVGTFAVVDQDKSRLAVSSETLDFVGDSQAGWAATINHESNVFGFLNKYQSTNVYMAVTRRPTAVD